MYKKFICFFISLVSILQFSKAQDEKSDFSIWDASRHSYTIANISVTGTDHMDTVLLTTLSGLALGDEITVPGDEKISAAIDKLWNNNLFSNIEIRINKIVDDYIFLDIHVTELPRLSKKRFTGTITKAQVNELKDKINLVNGRALTKASLKNAEMAIKDYFLEKGFNRAQVNFSTTPDPGKENYELLTIDVKKGQKVRVDNIYIAAVENAYESTVKSKIKDVKERMKFTLHPNSSKFYYQNEDTDEFRNDYWKSLGFLSITKTKEFLQPYINFNVFNSAKFDKKKLKGAKADLVNYYNSIGYRDAEVVKDTFYYNEAGNVNIELLVSEGNKYRFGDFYWRGNTKYDNATLEKLLSIEKGEVYSQSYLSEKLGSAGAGEGADITSLYQDDGYLFFNINPVEKKIYNDTIDFELRITEGPQATIRNINILGNDRTSDHVVRREIRTLPGNKYSRADIIRTMRELQNLGYFNPENIVPQPKPNMQDGTVDIDYTVEERSTDKLELSAGFGQGLSVFGTFGMSFNNFSLRNISHPETWDPLPMGDGQKLNLRLQSNGRSFNSESISFTEPWLGGRKPTSLTLAFNRTFYSLKRNFSREYGKPRDTSISQLGGSVSISKRIKWPDDNFILSGSVSYTHYILESVFNSSGQTVFIDNFTDGTSNNLNFGVGLSRYSVDNPLYPRYGSNISANIIFTPPYSLFNDKVYEGASPEEKFKWVEYQKLDFIAEWYQRVKGNLVFKMAAKYGFMGYYNGDIGFSPFERYSVGGDGLSGFGFAQNLLSRDIIAQRGYDKPYNSNVGSPIFNKYTMELRYPISLNPSSTIYALTFLEAANAWDNYKKFNPFHLNRSAGVGIRVFLPMFGLLGVDYGLGIDRYNPNNPGIKNFANFTFMLGREPK